MLRTDRSTPNLASDTLEGRYQKALKQINKLIIANNEARDQEKGKYQLLQSMELKYKKMGQLLEESQTEKQQLQLHLRDLTLKYQQLQEQNLQLCKSPISGIKVQKKTSIDLRHPRDFDNASLTSENEYQLKRKIQQYSDKNYEQLTKIEQLQRIGQNKNIKIQNLIVQCEELRRKIEQLQKNQQQMLEIKSIKNNQNFIEKDVDDLSKSKVVKRLKLSNHWVQNVNNQCTQLQAKVIQLQRNQKYASLKTQRSSPRLTSPISSVKSSKQGVGLYNDYMLQSQGDKRFTQILRRGKKIESQNKILKQKFQCTKQQLDRILKETSSEKKQLQKLRKQNQGYQNIIEKQEKQIKTTMDQYEKDLSKLTQDFKEKLNDQRKFLGVNSNDKKMKEIQGLENENKSIKKKYQAISQQLTKCYKLLEYQKAKVAQFESSFKNVAGQNFTLKEKIKNMSSPAREKISHKDEPKKIFLDNSLVESEKIPIPRNSFQKESYVTNKSKI